MISKTLENIEKEIKFIKEIATEEHFKYVEEMCNKVNKRNNNLQERINKAIEYISKHNCIAMYEEYTPKEYEYC